MHQGVPQVVVCMLQVIDKSLSGSCKTPGTCASGRDLRVLNQSNGAPPLYRPACAALQAACFQLAPRAFTQLVTSISREWAGDTPIERPSDGAPLASCWPLVVSGL